MKEKLSIHEKYMKQAIKLAMKAYELGEVPIGCVIVHEGKVIGRGYNRRTTDKSRNRHLIIRWKSTKGFWKQNAPIC